MSKLKLNDKNPSIKRILRELKDLNENPSTQFTADVLEDNLFDWHFTILGPPNTEFENGRYHGRIILPNEYPFKPPNIMLLTPNGRFQLYTKICLSITGYHPEFWQPAWGIRSVLVALISFLDTKAEGAVGGIECSKQERQRLAKLSLDWKCDTCHAKLRDLDLYYPEAGSETSKDDELVRLLKFAPEKKKEEASSGNVNPTGEGATEQTQSNQDEASVMSESVREVQSTLEAADTSIPLTNQNDATSLSGPTEVSVNTPPTPVRPTPTFPQAPTEASPRDQPADVAVAAPSQSTKHIDLLIVVTLAIIAYLIIN